MAWYHALMGTQVLLAWYSRVSVLTLAETQVVTFAGTQVVTFAGTQVVLTGEEAGRLQARLRDLSLSRDELMDRCARGGNDMGAGSGAGGGGGQKRRKESLSAAPGCETA